MPHHTSQANVVLPEEPMRLELNSKGHCGVTITPNYDPAQWRRCQKIISQATNQRITNSVGMVENQANALKSN